MQKPFYFVICCIATVIVNSTFAKTQQSFQASVPIKTITDTATNTTPSKFPLQTAFYNAETKSLTDTLSSFGKKAIVSKPLSARSIIIPSAMIAYGAFALSNKDLKNLNLSIRKEVWVDRHTSKKLSLDNFSLIAPAVAVYGLNIAGIKGKNNFVDRSILYTMSNLIGQYLIVSNVKKLSKVIRPDSSNYLSFPSGHSAQAFISAEFLRQEYKHISPWYGIAGYAVATGTGFLRMYNNKHWFNDVIAGAGIGILSTRLSYWLYPKLKNSFLRKFGGNTMVVPTYQNKSYGIGVVHTFQ